MDKGAAAFTTFRQGCPHFHQPAIERRPGNALNIEIGQPQARCLLKRPAHWPASASTLNWLGSGGSALVFGLCSRGNCALGQEWCSCGHRKEHHEFLGRPGCTVPNCTCGHAP